MNKELAIKKAYQTAANFAFINAVDDDIKAIVLQNQIESYMKRHEVAISREEIKAYVASRIAELRTASYDFSFAHTM